MTICTFIDIHLLPEEVILHALFFLPPKDLLLNCALVSKYFQELAYNEQLWWHHVFLENKHYQQEWTVAGEQTDPNTPITPMTPARTPLSSLSSTSNKSARMVWKRDRYIYHIGLDERFDRAYSFYDNQNDTHVLNPRHYYLESCLVQASSRENDHARDGETDVKTSYKTNGGANGFLDRNKALENKIQKGIKTPGKRHRLTITSVSTPGPSMLTPGTPTTPASPTTPSSPVVWLNQMFTTAVNNIRGKPPVNVNHRSLCVIGGFSERIQDDSQRENCVHMFDCGKQQFRSPVENFVKSDKPPLYGKHSAVLFDEDENRGIQGRIFLFGGSDGFNVIDDLFIYDLDKNTFLKAETKGERKPAPRVNHCACRIGDHHMYVLGGGVGKDMVPSSEIWILDTRTLEWELIEQSNDDVFTPRLGFTIAAINDKIILHGGAYWVQNKTEARWREAYKQTMLFDTKTKWWTLLHTTGQGPDVGSFPTSCLIGTQWFFISGATESNVTDEIFCFDTVTYKWRHMLEKSYLADGLSCCAYTHYGPNRQQKVIIFGGYRYAPLLSVSVLNVRWVDLMVKAGIMPLKQIDKGISVPGVATPIDAAGSSDHMFAYY